MNIVNHFEHLNIVSGELLEKGWSSDTKYILKDNHHKKYLVRLRTSDQMDKVKMEYQLMKQCHEVGIATQKPIEYGVYGEQSYLLLTCIEGIEASEMLPKLTNEQQYALGVQAGQYLRRIHALPSNQKTAPWDEKFNRKIDNKIRMYEQCDYKYDKGHLFLNYIENHRHLLDNRAQVPHHGDFHCGNMVINEELKLHIIDFNRCDIGEPWEEFNRIVWCAGQSSQFASGRIDGYFDGDVPHDFWQLLLLYISTNTLSSLPWGVQFGEDQIQLFKDQAAEILDWYDDLNTVIPNWYCLK
ncbi:aminoglycoside phosphotransferase family protein [Salinicoccus sesuvii]|uniref:Aminoglycoside phosphotransferase family protein n=1 Tax=Salinicoccus sesuvii TaxID=868281 RepID=A0ABV7N7K1_9STAP